MAYAERAGERAMRAVAYEEAAGHFTRALELLEGDGAEALARRCRWTLELGDALYCSGEHRAAGERFQDASRWAAEGGLAQLTVEAVDRWQTRGFVPGETNTVQLALVERALAVNGEAPDALRSRLYATKAQAIASTPERDAERVELGREAMRLARACDEPIALVAAMAAEATLGEPASLDAGEIGRVVARLDAGAPLRLRLLARIQLVRRLNFERAIAFEDANGARPFAVKARLEYARALADRGGTSEVERARALLAEARGAAEELGLGLHRRLASEIELRLP